ncbi:MAG: AAA family ATPase [Anaerolineae bacterium]|nr:AAA family ATPase [Anaerolineae bacterium]
MLEIQLLGTPRFTQAGKPLKLSRRKSIALLAYVAVNRQPYPRDVIAGLFWPEFDQSAARMNLRRDLSWLRQQLPEDILLIDRSDIEFNMKADVRIDVHQLEADLAFPSTHNHSDDTLCAECYPVIMKAIDLYQGEFMAGFSLADCVEFDEWLFFQREQRRQETSTALQRLVEWCCQQSLLEDGIGYGRRWLSLDPLNEPAHRALMQLYAWSDQPAAALRQYEECVRLLDEEFGIAPEPETMTLCEAIKANRLVISVFKERAREQSANKKVTPSEPLPKPPADTPAKTPSLPPFLKEETTPEPTTVFVAREREIAELEAALDSARTGHGQIMFVIGGAGRGKSVLTQEFARRAQIADPKLVVVSGFCDAMTGVGDPYLPFRGALTMLTGDVEAKWAGGLISQAHARRLWELMPLTLPALVAHAPDLIGNFIPAQALQNRAETVTASNTPWLKSLTALTTAEASSGLEQQRIFTQFTALLNAIAAQRPILLIIEDLHWVDTASSGLLFHLSRQIAESHILIIGTYRPEEVPLSWTDDRHPLAGIVSEIKRQHGDIWLDLGDLTAIEGRQFVDAYLDTQPNKLDEAFREALFRHTGGYALFTVELLTDMQDRGDLVRDEDGAWIPAAVINWRTLPAKVEGVIEKRIQSLEAEWQSVLTVASVEGETFTAEVVARVQELDERGLVHQLSRELDKQHRLVTAQTLERVGRQRLSRYRFRHHLFQHYLYHHLDEMERGYLHEAVGNVLELMYANRTEDVAVQLAWHFQEAGLVDKAIIYLQQAGDVAARVYAHAEAIASYRQALNLSKEYDVIPEDLTDLYSRLGRTLELNSQFDEALTNYEEMERVARQQGHRPMELASLMAQVTLYATPTPLHDPVKGPALGQETLDLARELGDQAAEAKTLWNLSLGGMWSGRTVEGIDYGERAADLARQNDLTELLAYALNDLGMLYLTRLHLEQAKQALEEVGRLWRKLDNLPMLTDSMSMKCAAHIQAGEYQQAVDLSNEAFQMSEASNNLWGQSFSRMFVCWAYWELGQPGKAIALAQESLRVGKLAGFIASQVLTGGFLADIYRSLGAIEQGLQVAQQAVTAAETQFPHFRCHPLGVLAQLHLLNGNLSEAEKLVEQGKSDFYADAHPAWNMRTTIADVELAFQKGEHDQAIAKADKVLSLIRQNNFRTYMPTFLHLRSKALLAVGQVEAAREGWLEARTVAETTGSRASLWPSLLALSQLESDPAAVQHLLQQARVLVESIADNIHDPDLRASFLGLAQVQSVFEVDTSKS